MSLTTTNPLVSVVILTWNRLDDLLETIGEVKKSTYKQIEIIVVDNGSTDGTIEVVGKTHPDVRLLALKENTGIAGYNAGMRTARGNFILLIDSDSFPEENSIRKMVSYFQKEPNLGVAAFDVRNYNDKEKYKNQDISNKITPGVNATGYNGAGAGIRKECIQKAGYLFEPFFLYFNEQDHSLRILQTGYSIKLFTSLIAFHKQSPIGRTNKKMAYYYTRNLLWLIWRNHPFLEMTKLTLRIFFYAALYSIKLKDAIYLNAVRDAIKGTGMIIKSRKPVSSDISRKTRIPINLPFSVYG